MARQMKEFVVGKEGIPGLVKEAREWLKSLEGTVTSGTWTMISPKKVDPEAECSNYHTGIRFVYDDGTEAAGGGDDEDGGDQDDESKPPGEQQQGAVAVGGKYYDSFGDAIYNVKHGDTVTLNEDIEQDESLYVMSNITLDLGGKKLTLTDGKFLCIAGATETVIKNGTIEQTRSSTSEGNYPALRVGSLTHDGAKVTLQNVTVKGSNAVHVIGDGTQLNIGEGCHIEGTGLAIATTTEENSGSPVINVNNGVIISSGNTAAAYIPSGTMNVHGGDIKGAIGILVRGGTLEVDGGIVRGTATKDKTITVGDAGYAVRAAVIAIDKNDEYNNGKVDVSIDGGIYMAPSKDDYAVSYTENGVVPEGASMNSTSGFDIWGGKVRGIVIDGAFIDADFEDEHPDFKYDDGIDDGITTNHKT